MISAAIMITLSHANDHPPSRMPLPEVTECFGRFAQGINRVDDGPDPSASMSSVSCKRSSAVGE